jgi:hypothetical protein
MYVRIGESTLPSCARPAIINGKDSRKADAALASN